jgi:hypothetical protein
MKPFVTIKEAAALTGLSQNYLRKRCKAGTLPLIKVSDSRTGTYLLDAESLVAQLRTEALRNVKEG